MFLPMGSRSTGGPESDADDSVIAYLCADNSGEQIGEN
jgi:hypothetical protein